MELVYCNHCYSGKAISITYCECMFVALDVQPAMRRCHIVVCDLTGSTIYFLFISHTARFVEKNVIQQNIFYLLLCNFLKHFRRFRKIAKSYYWLRHVRPPVCMEQLGSHWTDFHEIWYLRFFRKSVQKIQVSLKSGKNKGYFT